MAGRKLVYYLPLIPMGCMICMIIGVPIWVHYTVVIINQAEYALAVLGPSVKAPELFRAEQAIKGTSSMYLLFACGLFALGLMRKLLSVEYDLSVLNAKQLAIYRGVNAALQFIWWLIMVWVVVLMMGVAIFAILTWVSYHAVQAVLANQAVATPPVVAPAATCPSTCLNLQLFAFVETDPNQACVCDANVLRLVLRATKVALDAIPGMLVGIWFMYVFGDFFRTSLTCDFINASRDAEGERAGASGPGAPRSSSMARGYNKL